MTTTLTRGEALDTVNFAIEQFRRAYIWNTGLGNGATGVHQALSDGYQGESIEHSLMDPDQYQGECIEHSLKQTEISNFKGISHTEFKGNSHTCQYFAAAKACYIAKKGAI